MNGNEFFRLSLIKKYNINDEKMQQILKYAKHLLFYYQEASPSFNVYYIVVCWNYYANFLLLKRIKLFDMAIKRSNKEVNKIFKLILSFSYLG